mmetsp:Transcript_9800/g.15755  ORF Transcript_9800/g.15755 Transcript_9800/m.15755 type:complete len:203 (-) Transcript_9800:333-941(-)
MERKRPPANERASPVLTCLRSSPPPLMIGCVALGGCPMAYERTAPPPSLDGAVVAARRDDPLLDEQRCELAVVGGAGHVEVGLARVAAGAAALHHHDRGHESHDAKPGQHGDLVGSGGGACCLEVSADCLRERGGCIRVRGLDLLGGRCSLHTQPHFGLLESHCRCRRLLRSLRRNLGVEGLGRGVHLAEGAGVGSWHVVEV